MREIGHFIGGKKVAGTSGRSGDHTGLCQSNSTWFIHFAVLITGRSFPHTATARLMPSEVRQ